MHPNNNLHSTFTFATLQIDALACAGAETDEAEMRILMRGGLVATLSSMPLMAIAVDNGQYKDVPDHIRSWFNSVRSPHGVPCRDISDGHRTAYDIRSDGYWVPIEGGWYPVPPEAIVYNTKNPIGEAVVWYIRLGNWPNGMPNFFIRCFVPSGQADNGMRTRFAGTFRTK